MKYAWIENHRDEYTVSRLCRVLLVSRSGYCQWRVRAPSARSLANQALDTKVAAIHQGSRRSYDLPFVPRRHGTLRLRLRGTGQITLRSMAKTLAAAKGGITE